MLHLNAVIDDYSGKHHPVALLAFRATRITLVRIHLLGSLHRATSVQLNRWKGSINEEMMLVSQRYLGFPRILKLK
jgi:hypothetical protein